MIQSMTGYGKTELIENGKTIKAEIRSLNGKFLDINMRLPFSMKEKELEVRMLITEKMQRGKVDLFISIDSGPADKNLSFNTEIAKRYDHELKSLAKDLGSDKKNLLQAVLQIPEVISNEKNGVSEDDWKPIQEAIVQAMNDLISFRKKEGKGLGKIFRENVSVILSLLREVEKF